MFWPALAFALPFFVIPALMPGWRSLVATVIVGGAIILLLLILGLIGGGAAQFLGLAAILLAIPCLACGALSGFMRLALSRHVMSLPGKAATVLAPAALLFAAFYALHRQEEARWTLPDKACLDSVFPIVIGTSQIEVPMLAALSLYPNNNAQEAMYLRFPWVMRALCHAEEKRQGSRAAPAQLSAVVVDPSELKRAPAILRRSACGRPSLPDWIKRDCGKDGGKFPVVQKVAVLSLPDIDKTFFGVSETTYSQYLSATDKLQPLPKAGHFLRAREDRFHLDYFVAEPGHWMDSSGAPMSATCFSQQTFAGMSCRATLELSSGLVLHYTFTARTESFEVDFRAADNAARSFVTMLGLSAD